MSRSPEWKFLFSETEVCRSVLDPQGQQQILFFLFSVSQVEVERHPWLYNDEHGQQVGGFVKEFDNIAFVTVKVKLVWTSADLLTL